MVHPCIPLKLAIINSYAFDPRKLYLRINLLSNGVYFDKILPGITDLWQLSGDREKAIHENMDYDLYYLKNRSFFLDVAILLETLLFAFKGI